MTETNLKDVDIKASVALIINRGLNEFLIIRRAAHPKDPWSYQLAFPGGKIDHGEMPTDTVYRETYEECGLKLDDHQPETLSPKAAGRFAHKPLWVQPFLFEIDYKPTLSIQENEVDAYYWVKVEEFLNPDLHLMSKTSRNHPELLFPCFKVEENFLWGFTYHVLVSFFNKVQRNILNHQENEMIRIEKLF